MREKRHRLPDAAYYGPKTVSFTACIHRRRRPFLDEGIVREFQSHLEISAGRFACVVPIYCFMPDHLHVMIQGVENHSRPKEAIDDFKYTTGRWLAASRLEFEWQEDYHDRIMRASEDWRAHAFYIFLNPVRAGLVADPYAYPFTGSIGYDLIQMLHDISW
jgi:putative transposase